MDPNAPTPAEQLARMFHDAYERLAPDYGWKTQTVSRKQWEELPDGLRLLMLSVCEEIITALLEGKIIEYADPGDKLAMLLGKTEDGRIRVDFQKPLKWFAMDKDQAINFALTILQHCGVPVTVTLNPPPASSGDPV